MVNYLFSLVSYLLVVVGVLISVAFIVLVERKVLGYIQLRKGPNKVGFVGILQSFGDAIKLFTKEQMIPSYSNLIPYYFSPVVSFLVTLLLWSLIPTGSNYLNMSLGTLFFFCCTSFGVYTLLGSGWSSNSNYALLGAIRGVAQTISYEVAMALLLLSGIFVIGGYKLEGFMVNQEYYSFIFLMFPIFLMWFSSSLAETNRTPFDFAEGESELVSGFNIEYGSGGFALLFLAEYASIIFMSYLMVVIFAGSLNLIVFNLLGLFLCYAFIWVRGTLPRFRYDKLMGLAWKSYLPSSLYFLGFYMGVLMVSHWAGLI
uniref:NADH-ubiquinone oxidoreductase chain 1 n=1 Tax=Ceratophysella communis TaxID=1519100 RepID=A0A6G6A5H6_9HEXA|nr:NADH dehydrogenase subunit 1 [Ceratophysella communis]QID03198.1 NADH dehydrogenase subunit 1 [Ceratophysella communis]